MSLAKKSLWVAFLILAVTIGSEAAAVKTNPKILKVQTKPDIVLFDLEISPLSVMGDGSHVVQIRAVVANPVAMSSTGSFVLLAQKGAAATSIDRFLAERSVAGLSNTGATAKAPSAVVLFSDTVPYGATVHYRVKADAHLEVDETNEGNNVKEARYSTSPPIRDGGGDETVDLGVDLVVSQVEVTRGIFDGREKIQIIPTIRNMWHGRTAQRIKISFTGPAEVSIAEWIEGGIGPDETIRAGAVYLERGDTIRPLCFSVVADINNEIIETNEDNNRCSVSCFEAADTHEVFVCPPVGPHEPLT